MTKEEAVNQLKQLKECSDPEVTHAEADQILIAFLHDNGFSEIAEAWEAADDKLGFWYA